MNTTKSTNNTLKSVKTMTYCAILIALSIVIPNIFAPLRIMFGPVSATPASHVPMFISMFLGPVEAIAVGIGSVIGFTLNGVPTPIVLRAAMHIIIGLIGAQMMKKGSSFIKTSAILAPIHGILEMLVIIPLVGFTATNWIVCGVTILHHILDTVITLPLVKALMSAKVLDKKKILK